MCWRIDRPQSAHHHPGQHVLIVSPFTTRLGRAWMWIVGRWR
jgi:hypothetical protein